MAKNEGRALVSGIERAVSVGWGDEEPEEICENYVWFHVPADAPLDVAVLSAEPVIYKGHYMAGAVQPCSIPRCVHCQNGVGILRRVALSVYSLTLAARGILELGGGTGALIRALTGPERPLRGLQLRFSKEHCQLRGRILVEVYTGPLVVVELPAEQDPLVPLNAQWAKLALKRRSKDGNANIRHVGEAVDSLTQSSGAAVPSARISVPHLTLEQLKSKVDSRGA